jgi:hypothetical protein
MAGFVPAIHTFPDHPRLRFFARTTFTDDCQRAEKTRVMQHSRLREK